MSLPSNRFSRTRAPALWCVPVLLALSGCGDAGPDCSAPDIRNSVVRSVADDKNNALLRFAVENSDAVAQLVSRATAEAEKSAILEKAKQDAVYSLDNTIAVNSRSARAASCTGLLSIRVGDTTVQKDVDFNVEQTTDGKTSVSVKPFLF